MISNQEWWRRDQRWYPNHLRSNISSLMRMRLSPQDTQVCHHSQEQRQELTQLMNISWNSLSKEDSYQWEDQIKEGCHHRPLRQLDSQRNHHKLKKFLETTHNHLQWVFHQDTVLQWWLNQHQPQYSKIHPHSKTHIKITKLLTKLSLPDNQCNKIHINKNLHSNRSQIKWALQLDLGSQQELWVLVVYQRIKKQSQSMVEPEDQWRTSKLMECVLCSLMGLIMKERVHLLINLWQSRHPLNISSRRPMLD